ncbi:hypothetical protein NESM_000112700 [Novymonas esmeraldas]|uniref:Uncharacterized protein n=1 Tax=Novymonas esmeraldas TaxID=1808958 RepID=A0AAW0F5X8_9TRYP
MQSIMVQLVFAFVGVRVPYFMPAVPGAPVAPLSARGASTNTSPRRTSTAAPNVFTVQELLSRLEKVAEPAVQPAAAQDAAPAAADAASPPSSPAAPPPMHRSPLLELFDYASLSPLDGTAVLCNEQVLLVLCTVPTTTRLVEALQLEWLEVYSGAHRPNRPASAIAAAAHDGDLAVCTTEEKLRNVVHALRALSQPVAMHLQLLSDELAARETALAAQKEEMARLRPLTAASVGGGGGGDSGASSSAAERATSLPLLEELEPGLALDPTSSAGDAVHTKELKVPLALCEVRVLAVDALLQRAAKHHRKLMDLAERERGTESAFRDGGVSRALAEYLERGEQDRAVADSIIAAHQVEMTRQLKAVRHLVAYITQVRGLVSKAKYNMGAVALVLSRLSLAGLRPRLLEEAEALLHRRVILRRAARRQLLLLQETECVELRDDLEAFSQRKEVQKALPDKVRWYLRAPLPDLQPAEDPVATRLDHALIDRDEDEAQELVESTRLPNPIESTNPAENAQHIVTTLLPVAKLSQRLASAHASVERYKIRVQELEERLSRYETTAGTSSPPLPGSVAAKVPSTECTMEGAFSDDDGDIETEQES